MGWPHLRYEQTNLPALCRHRDVFPTEYHFHNQLYGLSWLIKQYANLPRNEPLPWAMEHAILFENPRGSWSERDSRMPIVLAINAAQAEILQRYVPGRVHAIGSAFFYMQHLYHRQHPDEPLESTDRRGTLVFPDKSTTNNDTDFDRDRLARELLALPAEFQPIAVSVFWRDFERGTHRPFEKAGLMVVSSGHPYDPLFLFRQYNLCRQFKYACANDLSGSFCMAVLAGCRFFYWQAGPVQMTRHGVTQTFDRDPTLALPGKLACLAASPFPPRGDGSDQRELAERFAGKASLRFPEFFREWYAEGHRLLQATPPPDLRFDSAVELNQLARWLAQGIDPNGCVAKEASLVIPARPGHAGVRLRVDPMARRRILKGRLSVKLTLTLDDGTPRTCRLWWGECWINVPVPPDGQTHRLRLSSDHDVGWPFRARRSIRLRAIEWQRHFASEPVIRAA